MQNCQEVGSLDRIPAGSGDLSGKDDLAGIINEVKHDYAVIFWPTPAIARRS